MPNEKFKVIYENNDLLVIDKPAGMIVDNIPKRVHRLPSPLLGEEGVKVKMNHLVHRLDKDTSGVLIVAKNDKTLEFLQKQFKERRVEKKYIALIVGHLKTKQGIIETLIGRSPKDRRKQKVFLAGEPDSQGKREAVTKYKVLKRLKNFDLVEITPKTGRKHQIRCHFAYLGHPIVGDKMYGFKNQILPKGLKRHFLHASYLKIKLPDGKEKEFQSDLPEDLKSVLEKLNEEKEE